MDAIIYQVPQKGAPKIINRTNTNPDRPGWLQTWLGGIAVGIISQNKRTKVRLVAINEKNGEVLGKFGCNGTEEWKALGQFEKDFNKTLSVEQYYNALY